MPPTVPSIHHIPREPLRPKDQSQMKDVEPVFSKITGWRPTVDCRILCTDHADHSLCVSYEHG